MTQDSTDINTLVPVQIGGQVWYAMPFSRLAKIGNSLAKCDSLLQVASLVPLLDSSLNNCKEIVGIQKLEINSFEAIMKSYDLEVAKQDSIIKVQHGIIDNGAETITKLNKKLDRQKKKGKNVLVICGTAIAILLGLLVAAIAIK